MAGNLMRFVLLLLLAISCTTYAAQIIIPVRKDFQANVYSKEGNVYGCGMRIIGLSDLDLSGQITAVDFSINYFRGARNSLGGVLKITARTINTKNLDRTILNTFVGEPIYVNFGWARMLGKSPIKQLSGARSEDNNGYIAILKFEDASSLLLALMKDRIQIGFNTRQGAHDQIFEFNGPIPRSESARLVDCMKVFEQTIK